MGDGVACCGPGGFAISSAGLSGEGKGFQNRIRQHTKASAGMGSSRGPERQLAPVTLAVCADPNIGRLTWPAYRHQRSGPIKVRECSTQNTWLCKFAIHCRPAAVTFRWAIASVRCGEILFQ